MNVGPMCPLPSRACSRRSRGRSPTARVPTRSRARSSSPEPRSSGCATASVSSEPRPRSARSPSRARTPRACTSSRRSPASAARTGIRTRAAPSSAHAGHGPRAPGARRRRGDGLSDPRRCRGDGAASGRDASRSRADGGAAVMDLLLQLQADQLQVPVARPTIAETTALGAAYLAGLAAGVWSSLDEVASLWQLDREFTPGRPLPGPTSATRAGSEPWTAPAASAGRASGGPRCGRARASSCRSRARNGRPLRPSTSS